MLRKIAAVLFIAPVIACEANLSQNDQGQPEYYYEKPVNIKGTLVRELIGFPSLRPDDLFSVSSSDGDPEGLEPREFGVGAMQLVISEKDLWKKFESLKGKKAIVNCSLYHAVTIYHHTPVMCSVNSISPAKIK
ncbi:DUF4431 domain-containing protein [Xenorhabdus bovienii]|uniref:DUF4431 domain-containing protein n=1 Tax=Xenorhabdus bovienii str. kraussei Becker Underwood TaxID=1398204 RepID=A0A077Q099_XENBV|nr:DUF4431 domain-containing protein [Xenorhabdus bovienii]CDH26411.1 conserved exported hypothetical protein [Xenorhabdus bovienii str. kraussei Becker Underwood]